MKTVSTDAVAAKAAVAGAITAAEVTALEAAHTAAVLKAANGNATVATTTAYKTLTASKVVADKALADATASGASTTTEAANVAALDAAIAAAAGTAATAAAAKKTTTDLTTRMQLDVKASVESTNGITYGAFARYRSDGTLNGFNAPQLSMSTGGLTIRVGNNNGQMYKAAMSASNVGLTGLGYPTYVVSAGEYSSQGTGMQGVDVDYSMGGFSIGMSQSKNITVGTTTGNTQTQAGVSYSAGAITVGAAMQDGKTKAEDANIVAASYTMDGASFEIAHGSQDGEKKTRVGGTFDLAAATSVTAFVVDTNTAGEKSAYGLGVSHDLGGASLKAGYVKTATGSQADFGVSFNF